MLLSQHLWLQLLLLQRCQKMLMHFVSDIIWYVAYLDTSEVSGAVVAPIPAAHPDLLRHLKHHFPRRTALVFPLRK